MLENLNKKDIVIPVGLKMNNDFDTYGGILAWSGFALIYRGTVDGPERVPNFNLIAKPV